ncbi:MAG: protein kinase [Acidobacteriaceae bacterium]
MASQEQAVEQLFGAALDQRPEDRRAFLDRACATAPELRQRVEELLLADEQAGSFLERKPKLFAPPSDLTQSAVESTGGLAKIRGTAHCPTGRFQPGQTIADRFEVVRFIDRGGMGEVYEVEDRFLHGAHVALKVILPDIADPAESAHRFKREVLLARKVTHPNLCPIYDIAHSELPPPAFLFLTMKLLSGETLASRLTKAEKLSRSEIISIFRQMISGVAAMHAAGVVHGDIKPRNVMLETSESGLCLSIMDFGLARLYASQATVFTHQHIAGTPGYMAPELLRGNPPSQATDIFALGVLLQQVLTNEKPNVSIDGLTAKPSSVLEAADAPPILIQALKEFLSPEPLRRSHAFEQIQPAFEAGGDLESRKLVVFPGDSHPTVLNRRNFIVGSSIAVCGAAAGIFWNRESLVNRANDLLHPLPLKRFVALLNWPPSSDTHIRPILAGVIDAIGNELARAEAFDRNLFVIAQKTSSEITTPAQLNQLRESLGANLVLAASGTRRSNGLHVLLSVLDAATTRTLRAQAVNVSLEQQLQLPEKAVQTAAKLLDITQYRPEDQHSNVGTTSPSAYAAFLTAESLRKKENDTGLDAAIEKYKQAIDIDPRYAIAEAELAWAYLRSYGLRREPAALTLAGLNCKSAIKLDPNLVDAHLGLASFYRQTGDDDGAAREMSKALALDPSNAHTLTYQGDFYASANKWDKAEETFHRVLELRPNYWLAHNEWGAVLEDQGKYPEALTEFRAASLIAPGNAFALRNVGHAYLRLGKLPEALGCLSKSYKMNQDDTAAIALAEAYRLQQKYPEAISYGEMAVKLDPNEPSYWLELGDISSAAGKHRSEAEDAYKQAAATEEEKLRTSPNDGPNWMLMALVSAKIGQQERSLSLIKKAESLHADDMDSQLSKVRTLELAGRRDDALATMARCLRRGPTLFQFERMPDLEKLRASPEFKRMAASNEPVV